jgi:hypothetical protein
MIIKNMKKYFTFEVQVCCNKSACFARFLRSLFSHAHTHTHTHTLSLSSPILILLTRFSLLAILTCQHACGCGGWTCDALRHMEWWMEGYTSSDQSHANTTLSLLVTCPPHPTSRPNQPTPISLCVTSRHGTHQFACLPGKSWRRCWMTRT